MVRFRFARTLPFLKNSGWTTGKAWAAFCTILFRPGGSKMNSAHCAGEGHWGVRSRKALQFTAVALGALLLSAPLFSQGSFGTILGTVTDPSGGVIPGATVTILNTATGVSRTLTTDSAGEYNAPTLIPGTYTVRAEAKSFKTIESRNVLLEVGKEVRVDFTLQPGAEAQTITVTAAPPLVSTTNATLGGTVESTQISNLPLNGRNYQYLMTLRPGVMIQPGGGPWTSSTNGVRPDTAVIMVDGVINFSWYDSRSIANDSSAFTDEANILPVDAIQEFNIEENPKAEYGWRDGAVMNVGIKSGTNSIHGSAYAFGRDGSWDARDAFNSGLDANGTCLLNPTAPFVCNQTPTQLEQFGGTVGGPIKKDKLFYFAGYEGLRDTVGSTFAVQVPQTGAGGGPANSMVDAITALQNAGVARSIVSEDLLGCTGDNPKQVAGPFPAVTCTGGLIANDPANKTLYESSFPINTNSDNGIAKINYNLNDKNMISGMFWTGRYGATGQDKPQMNSLYLTNLSIVGYSDVEDWVYSPNSRWVNDFRFGYDRTIYVQGIADSGIIPNGMGGLCTATGCGNGAYPLDTGVTRGGGLPPITIAGFGGAGDVLGQSNSGRPSTEGPHWYYDFQDNASYLRGKHAIKFGGEFIVTGAQQNVDNFRGNLVLFNGGQTPGVTDCGGMSCSLEDFFAGNPASGSVNVGNPLRQMRWNQFALYVQDDWRVKPRLMVNLGLRYEYSQPIREINNLYGNFDPNSQFGIVQQGQPGVGNSLWKPNRTNFAPRLGFAWDTTGKGTTVVRGGVGMMYSEPIARYFMDNAPPNGALGNISQDPSGAELVSQTPLSGFTACPAPNLGSFCHAGTGTINFGAPSFLGSSLNWNGVLFPQGGLACTPTAPCSLYAVSPNLKTPYVVNYNLGVQHLITSNLSLDVAYVGNHGYDLLSPYDVNECAPNPNGNCVRPYGTQFPYLGIITLMDNYGYSNFNSLQVTLTQRTSHGLDFIAGYTYGHGLDNGSLNLNEEPPQNSLDRAAEYASSDFDIRHRFTLALNYAIPGKKGYGQLLEGWKLNTIVTLQTAQPWLVFDRVDSFSTDKNPLADFSDRWDFFGNPNDFKSGGANSIMHCSGPGDGQCSQTSGVTGQLFCENAIGTSTTNPGACDAATSAGLWNKCTAVANPVTLGIGGCYLAGNSVMVPPALGTYGTMGRNIFRDTGFADMDFSVFKDFTFKERYTAEFRVELFNVLNHPNYANPYGASNTYFGGSDPSSPGSFGCGCATPDVAAGNPVIGSGSNRVMQLGLKLTF
jgi:hypothetical protein